MSFSQNLTDAAESRNLTLAALAEKSKLPAETVASWVKGGAYPQFDEMKQLSRALGMDAETLIPEEELDQYINFSLNASGTSSPFGDVLLVGAILIGLTLGFVTESFAIGAAGVLCGTVAGLLIRRLYIKKKD